MLRREFLELLQVRVVDFADSLSTPNGDWVVKGFIDVARNVYPIPSDTKVISKILELTLLPLLEDFAGENRLRMIAAKRQNFYPDLSFIDDSGNIFALDLKSTYRIGANRVSGMTLGAFTGYFRDRKSKKNIMFPYGAYSGHFVLGIIYSKGMEAAVGRRSFSPDEVDDIPSVLRELCFFVQDKYRIASDRPGSGNTKNIGSVTNVEALIAGKGPFARLGEHVFDDYWMGYMTKDMARAAGLPAPPYHNLETYFRYKGMEG